MIKIDTKQSLPEIWKEHHFEFKEGYENHHSSFIAYLLPEVAIGLSAFEVLDILRKKFGTERLIEALDPSKKIHGPVIQENDGEWLKKANITGINVRTTGNFFNVIKYLLTVPAVQNAVHLLPVWEPGILASLYGKISWNINPEFFSQELHNAVPHLDTPEKQLKVTINLIHLMGKTAGMEVIPHTDRFSEMTLAFPRFFEWLKRVGGRISDITDTLHKEVEDIIWLYLHRNGTANQTPLFYSKSEFFDPDATILDSEQKLEILFGRKKDFNGRLSRRKALIHEIISQGFETLPLAITPPYRNLHINQEEFVLDDKGNKWYTYEPDQPEALSRVYGSLTRYKFYLLKDKSRELDFDKPNLPAWEYLAKQYAGFQEEYNFDFMRGSMAHIQPRKEGVPSRIPVHYDPLSYVRSHIAANGAPYFGFLAETFLAEQDTMAYGVEEDHLEAIRADVSLGSLHICSAGSPEYLEKLAGYHHIARKKRFQPVYTLITGDTDDPAFDPFYKKGNHLRLFTGMFLKDMPSYVSAGFETRSLHQTRAHNEEYNSLFLFSIQDSGHPEQNTNGPFLWGNNYEQFSEVTELRYLSDEIMAETGDEPMTWLSGPSTDRPILVWQAGNYLFVANQHPEQGLEEQNFQLEILAFYDLIYSSTHFTNRQECRIYKKRPGPDLNIRN